MQMPEAKKSRQGALITTYFKPRTSSNDKTDDVIVAERRNEPVVVEDDEPVKSCASARKDCWADAAETGGPASNVTDILSEPCDQCFTCPVCNFKLSRIKCLFKFNEHVDNCLNRHAIAEIL